MTQRRTLKKPNAEGHWMYKQSGDIDFRIYYVFGPYGSAGSFWARRCDCHSFMNLDDMHIGQWQGPIEWEDSNAQNA